jgi:hypothetical protein
VTFTFANLDAQTRQQMVQEIKDDVASSRLYLSPRLSPQGRQQYPALLTEAAEKHNEAWLAQEIRSRGLLNATETRNKPKGGTTEAAVPVTAPDTLAEGEFNRFYCRGLCRRAVAESKAHVVVYRGKPVSNPRPESEAKVGAQMPAAALLNDLRTHVGVDTALGLPAGPNSGLTVRLP